MVGGPGRPTLPTGPGQARRSARWLRGAAALHDVRRCACMILSSRSVRGPIRALRRERLGKFAPARGARTGGRGAAQPVVQPLREASRCGVAAAARQAAAAGGPAAGEAGSPRPRGQAARRCGAAAAAARGRLTRPARDAGRGWRRRARAGPRGATDRSCTCRAAPRPGWRSAAACRSRPGLRRRCRACRRRLSRPVPKGRSSPG